MDLEFRLQLLQDSAQISAMTREVIRTAMARLEDRWGVILTEDNGAMLVTHLAIAWERIAAQGTVAALDELIFAEVKNSRFFNDSQAVLADLEAQWQVTIPEAERGYLLLHFCTLWEREKGSA